MNKKKISILECNIGDIIAEDVITSSGLKLIGRNAIVTDYIKNKILETNITYIFIYDPSLFKDPKHLFKQDYLTNITAIKDILNLLSSGEKQVNDQVLQLSDKLYSGINLSSQLIKCLNELKGADEYTYTHSINTAFYAMLIAKWLDFNDQEIKKSHSMWFTT